MILRDFIVYEIKLLLDGIKDVGISFLALFAVAFDMVLPGDSPGRRFYAVMRLGERLDRWLSLYGVAEAAERDVEGMFGVSRAGSPTLLGRLEALIHDAMVGEEDELVEELATTAPDEGPTQESDGAAGADDDLFSRGIAALDRAVDVLDRDRPAPPAPPPAGQDAAQTDEAPRRGEATDGAPRRGSRSDVPPS